MLALIMSIMTRHRQHLMFEGNLLKSPPHLSAFIAETCFAWDIVYAIEKKGKERSHIISRHGLEY